MGEQVLRVQKGNTAYDIATQDDQGKWSVRVFDESTRDAINQILSKVDDGTASTVISAIKDVYVRLNDQATEATLTTVAKESTLSNLRTDLNAKDFATEVTLEKILGQLDDATADTVLSVLKDIKGIDFAKESTQATLAKESTLQDVHGQLTIRAKESTLQSVLNSLNDGSTDTILSLLKALVAEVGTEATLADVLAKLGEIDLNTDAIESQITTTHSKLDNVKASIDSTHTTLNSINGKDFATEATLSRIIGQLDDATADTVIGVLKALLAELEQKSDNPLTDLELRASDVGVADGVTHTKLDAVKTSIDNIDADHFRRTDPLATGSNLIGYVSSAAVLKSSLARVFIGTSGEVSAGLGQSIRATIQNPVGSGKNILLVKLTATSGGSGGLVVGDVYINPDTNLPTTQYTPFCTAVGAASASAIFKVDSGGAMSGGQATDLHLGIVGTGRLEFNLDAPVIISQGLTLGLNIPLGALESTDGQFGAYWIEEPA